MKILTKIIPIIALALLTACTGRTAAVKPELLELPEYREKVPLSASFRTGADGLELYEGPPDENSLVGVSIDLKKIQETAAQKIMSSLFSATGNDSLQDVNITGAINNFRYEIIPDGLSNYPSVYFILKLEAYDKQGILKYSKSIDVRGYKSEVGYFPSSFLSLVFTQTDANRLSQLVGNVTLKKVAEIYFIEFEKIAYEFKNITGQ